MLNIRLNFLPTLSCTKSAFIITWNGQALNKSTPSVQQEILWTSPDTTAKSLLAKDDVTGQRIGLRKGSKSSCTCLYVSKKKKWACCQIANCSRRLCMDAAARVTHGRDNNRSKDGQRRGEGVIDSILLFNFSIPFPTACINYPRILKCMFLVIFSFSGTLVTTHRPE